MLLANQPSWKCLAAAGTAVVWAAATTSAADNSSDKKQQPQHLKIPLKCAKPSRQGRPALCEKAIEKEAKRTTRWFPEQILNPEKLTDAFHEEPTLRVKHPVALAVMTRAW